MKGVLKFDLSDHDERQRHMRCLLSTKMASVLWEVSHNLFRNLEKDDAEEYNEAVLKTISHIDHLMEQNGININELID